MNQNSSTDTSTASQSVSAEAISRRAYEIWEREGRPDGCDLRHWLQAEEELGVRRSDHGSGVESGSTSRFNEPAAPRTPGAEARPPQTPRAGTIPSRTETKRTTTGTEKTTSRDTQNGAKRKPANAPVM